MMTRTRLPAIAAVAVLAAGQAAAEGVAGYWKVDSSVGTTTLFT